MRLDPRYVVLSLMFAAVPVRGDGVITFPGPGGVRVIAGNELPSRNPIELMAMRTTGLADGYRLAGETPGIWRSLALQHDSTLTWPRGGTIVATCDGREVKALDLFAMTPPYEQRVIRLGGAWAVDLEPSKVWQRLYQRGPREWRVMSTVLFVRFPVDSCRGDITAMRYIEGR
jgi:hypothetical protein